MPTYEYACRDCEEHLEVVQSFHDEALTECPACAGELRKVFSAAGIIFKGSGWHIKDYASSGASTAASSDSASGSEGRAASKDGAKADTKAGSKDGSKASSDGSSSAKGSSSGSGSSSSTSSEKAAPAKKSA